MVVVSIQKHKGGTQSYKLHVVRVAVSVTQMQIHLLTRVQCTHTNACTDTSGLWRGIFCHGCFLRPPPSPHPHPTPIINPVTSTMVINQRWSSLDAFRLHGRQAFDQSTGHRQSNRCAACLVKCITVFLKDTQRRLSPV